MRSCPSPPPGRSSDISMARPTPNRYPRRRHEHSRPPESGARFSAPHHRKAKTQPRAYPFGHTPWPDLGPRDTVPVVQTASTAVNTAPANNAASRHSFTENLVKGESWIDIISSMVSPAAGGWWKPTRDTPSLGPDAPSAPTSAGTTSIGIASGRSERNSSTLWRRTILGFFRRSTFVRTRISGCSGSSWLWPRIAVRHRSRTLSEGCLSV